MMTDDRQPPDDPAHESPDSRLGHQLWQTQHAVERAFDDALKPVGVGVTQVAALLHLHRQPGLSGAELARRLLVTPQSTATLLAGLETRGWVTRSQHPMHRTLIEATLTDAGRSMLREGVAVIQSVDAAISRGMSTDERSKFSELLSRCLQNARAAVSQSGDQQTA